MKRSSWLSLLVFAFLAACTSVPEPGTIDTRPLVELLHAKGIDRHIGIKPATATTEGDYTYYEFDTRSPARCLEGAPYHVTVRKGTSKNVMLYLQGGGGCWDYDSCYVNSMAQTTSSRLSDNRRDAAVFDRANPENPVKDWNLVYASYCDGSIWSGDADADYNGRTTFHHGLANLSGAVTLLKQHFPDAPKILVTGSSAGGYGTLMGFMVTRTQFPETPLYVLNDAGPWLMNPDNHDMTDKSFVNWGVEQFVPNDCPRCKEQMYFIADWAMHRDENSRWALFSYDQDLVVGTLYLQYGGKFTDVLVGMTDWLVARSPGQFAGYFLHGPVHTILGDADAFPDAERDGVKLVEWIGQMVNDSPNWTDRRH